MNVTKKKTIQSFVFLVIGIVLINVISFRFFKRFDFTEDKRFSISNATKKLLDSLEGDIYVDVCFDGSASANYLQLKNAIEETLDEFKSYYGGRFIYGFSDPYEYDNDTVRSKIMLEYAQQGLTRAVAEGEVDGKRTEKLVFPGAFLTFNGHKEPINFLKRDVNGQKGIEENFAQSTNEIEFELTHAIKRSSSQRRKVIAFLDGHGEPKDLLHYPPESLQRGKGLLTDAISSLSQYYLAGRLNLSTIKELQKGGKEGIDMLVIDKPTKAFSDEDIYKIDQFVLNGGKVIFLIDPIHLERDSTGLIGVPYKLNLDNLFRQYGIQLKDKLVDDFYAESFPIQNANGQTVLHKWGFNPILSNFNKEHIITKKLNPILGKEVSVLDTVVEMGMKKSPLLFTCQDTRVAAAEIFSYNVNELRFDKEESFYKSGPQTVAYLVEGEAKSVYTNRPKPKGVTTTNFVKTSKNAQVVVIADGDMITNIMDPRASYEMGFYAQKGLVYANKSFFMNIVNYLLNEQGIVTLKAKEVKPRPLDGYAIDQTAEQRKWQFINLVVPVMLVIVFGFLWSLLRKRKYTKAIQG